jgi:hypothetical protein
MKEEEKFVIGDYSSSSRKLCVVVDWTARRTMSTIV